MLILDRNKISPTILVDAYAQWMNQMESKGAKLYYVNVMFDQMHGPKYERAHKMKHLIERFYAQYVTQFVHHPRARGEQEDLPQFWLYPDLPGPKKDRTKFVNIALNGGLHFNGAMVIRKPLRGETKIRGIKRHFHQNQQSYAKDGIERIHVKRIRHSHSQLIDYALKTIKTNRWDDNDILILPKIRQEVMRSPALSSQERCLKNVMSAHNFSPEVAQIFLRAAVVRGH
jgi:hypothetical protein